MTPVFLLGCANFSGRYRSVAGDFRTGADYAESPVRRPSPKLYTPPTGPFSLAWPVNSVQINRGYRPKRAPSHAGMDLGGRLGTPILAAHPGRVIYAGRDFRGYGKMVLIEYNHEWATLYGHLNRIGVSEGDVVNKGEEIGKMGRTGHASGVHLHFELIRKRQPVDPLPFLKSAKLLAL